VEPNDVTQWTPVDYVANGGVSDFTAAGVIITIFGAGELFDTPRVSAVTMEACIPRTRNHSLSLFSCLYRGRR